MYINETLLVKSLKELQQTQAADIAEQDIRMSISLPQVEGATLNLRCMRRYQHPLSKLRAQCVNYFKRSSRYRR